MKTYTRFVNWADSLWCVGRRSKTAYIRFYPNPGFMFPWGKRFVKWSVFYGLTTGVR